MLAGKRNQSPDVDLPHSLLFDERERILLLLNLHRRCFLPQHMGDGGQRSMEVGQRLPLIDIFFFAALYLDFSHRLFYHSSPHSHFHGRCHGLYHDPRLWGHPRFHLSHLGIHPLLVVRCDCMGSWPCIRLHLCICLHLHTRPRLFAHPVHFLVHINLSVSGNLGVELEYVTALFHQALFAEEDAQGYCHCR